MKSALCGDSDAQNNVGRAYQKAEGVTKDEKTAFEWYTKGESTCCFIVV